MSLKEQTQQVLLTVGVGAIMSFGGMTVTNTVTNSRQDAEIKELQAFRQELRDFKSELKDAGLEIRELNTRLAKQETRQEVLDNVSRK